MSRHCRECGKLMQSSHGGFTHAGGYRCINKNCPNCPDYRYEYIERELWYHAYRATKLQQWIQNHD